MWSWCKKYILQEIKQVTTFLIINVKRQTIKNWKEDHIIVKIEEKRLMKFDQIRCTYSEDNRSLINIKISSKDRNVIKIREVHSRSSMLLCS